MADQLCTAAQVKTRLGITDSVDDAVITEMVEQASDFVQHYTGRKFVPEAGVTYVFDTFLGYVLRVPRGIRAITTMGVALSNQPDTGGAYTTVTAADRILRPLSSGRAAGWPATEVRFSRGTLAGTIASFGTVQNGCTITGDFGFAATPPDIQAVTIDTVVAAFQSRKNGVSGVIGADDGAIVPWSQFFSRGSPQRQTLERYRIYPV